MCDMLDEFQIQTHFSYWFHFTVACCSYYLYIIEHKWSKQSSSSSSSSSVEVSVVLIAIGFRSC
ncbi:hypothetical protein T07_2114 [Trichinella nelsoni]|uniref:Uncharacterized protein n=1 Tax=Trichinella nelsoni TaxID=6336 RepID=A0A0V0S0V4_9BILA|nr:hypothetical protein T07_2114 [Trichinella nelsoni]